MKKPRHIKIPSRNTGLQAPSLSAHTANIHNTFTSAVSAVSNAAPKLEEPPASARTTNDSKIKRVNGLSNPSALPMPKTSRVQKGSPQRQLVPPVPTTIAAKSGASSAHQQLKHELTPKAPEVQAEPVTPFDLKMDSNNTTTTVCASIPSF